MTRPTPRTLDERRQLARWAHLFEGSWCGWPERMRVLSQEEINSLLEGGEDSGRASAEEPSMEDILASIRRILDEDDAPAKPSWRTRLRRWLFPTVTRLADIAARLSAIEESLRQLQKPAAPRVLTQAEIDSLVPDEAADRESPYRIRRERYRLRQLVADSKPEDLQACLDALPAEGRLGALALLCLDASAEQRDTLAVRNSADIPALVQWYASLATVEADAVARLADALQARLDSRQPLPQWTRAGIAAVMLGRLPHEDQEENLRYLPRHDAAFATAVWARLMTFEDLMATDDASLSAVVAAETDPVRWAVALKGASGGLRERVLHSLPEERSQDVREQMAAMGPVRQEDVDVSQGRIVLTYARLAVAGEARWRCGIPTTATGHRDNG